MHRKLRSTFVVISFGLPVKTENSVIYFVQLWRVLIRPFCASSLKKTQLGYKSNSVVL
jgi:hypothetical protein